MTMTCVVIQNFVVLGQVTRA